MAYEGYNKYGEWIGGDAGDNGGGGWVAAGRAADAGYIDSVVADIESEQTRAAEPAAEPSADAANSIGAPDARTVTKEERRAAQRMAAAEKELREQRKALRAAQRKTRNHRLIEAAANVEAEAGIELDAKIGRWIGRKLKKQLADPQSELSRYVAERAKLDDSEGAE